MKMSPSNILIAQIDRRHQDFAPVMEAITKGHDQLKAPETGTFEDVEQFTYIDTSNMNIQPWRAATRLLQCRRNLEAQMVGQYCSYQQKMDPDLMNFLGGREDDYSISDFEQSHLLEHLLKSHLRRIRQVKAPIESRTVRLGQGYPDPVRIVIANHFEQAKLRELVQYTWHLLGRAIRRGVFPNPEEFNASLYLRYQTLSDKDFALKLLKKSGIPYGAV
jgi:hypothetical protein